MDWIEIYLISLLGLFSDLWLFFLIGFLMAGIVSEFVPRRALLRYLGKNSLATILRATLSGTVTSICSCGAIPIAVTLRRGGASRAAALTFMLAAPWAGFLQLFIFYKFLGFSGTAVVFLGALSVAFCSGMVLGHLEDRGWLDQAGPHSARPSVDLCEELSLDQNHDRLFQDRLISALEGAWEAFRELWKFLGLGILLAAGLKAFIPTAWVTGYLGANSPFNPLLVAVPLATVVELCSEGFSIFAGQLHEMGATLAVIFVVVIVGVSTDFTELSVIVGRFGKRCAVAYLSVSTVLAIVFALVIQVFSNP